MAATQVTLSAQLAEDLLRAWTSGDRAQVQAELARSLAVPPDPDDICEEERRHLVQAVAERMRGSRDIFRNGDPALKLCAHLLHHLVCGEAGGRAAVQVMRQRY